MPNRLLRSGSLAGAVVVAGAMTSAAAPAWADTVALTPTRTVGNQAFTGALGMDFDVLTPIVITQLGAFDSGSDGFSGAIQVGVISRDTGLLMGTSVTLTSTTQPLVGGSRFFNVTDYTLPIGRYSIVAVGFSATDQNGNSGGVSNFPVIDTGGGLISFVGSSRWTTSTSLVLPSNIDAGPAARYDAGTFQFVAASVPELPPALMWIAGLGMLAAFKAGARRRGG